MVCIVVPLVSGTPQSLSKKFLNKKCGLEEGRFLNFRGPFIKKFLGARIGRLSLTWVPMEGFQDRFVFASSGNNINDKL